MAPVHLLLIEYNLDLVGNIADFLEERGHTLDIAYIGFAGLGFALEHDYDAAILDLMLPGLDRLEVCAKLREQRFALILPLKLRRSRIRGQRPRQNFRSQIGQD